MFFGLFNKKLERIINTEDFRKYEKQGQWMDIK